MKKREIITLLEYQKSLEDSKHLNLEPHTFMDGTSLKYSEEFLRELENRYGKLVDHVKYQTENSDKIKSIHCTHPVLFFVDRKYCKTHRCILCGENLELDNPEVSINLEETVEIEETATPENRYIPLNNFYYIYNRIIQMLKDKDDEEEIDFPKEFRKQFENFEIGNFIINRKEFKKIYNILLIGGSNELKLDGHILTNESLSKKIEWLLQYFTRVYRINTTLITSQKSVNNYIENCSSLRYEYITMGDLLNILENINKTNFDLIIDATNLFEYNIIDGKININSVSIDLKKYFPISTIFKVKKEPQFGSYVNNFLLQEMDDNNAFTEDFKKVLLKKPL